MLAVKAKNENKLIPTILKLTTGKYLITEAPTAAP
jgi:hypothetical protein